MSIYTVTNDKNILNTPKVLESYDVSTRNQYLATVIGMEAGYNNKGKFNTFIGYKSGNKNTSGNSNTFLGANAGLNAGDDFNILIGVNAGAYMTSGSGNIMLGTYAGQYSRGSYNIYIGHNNTNTTTFPNSSNNIGIGGKQTIMGYNNISIGNNISTFSYNSLIYGNNTTDSSKNSILIGNNITNTGSNCCILRTNPTDTLMSNNSDWYTNINNIIVNRMIASNETNTYINGDALYINGKYSQAVFKQYISLSNAYGHINISEQDIDIASDTSSLTLSSNITMQTSSDLNITTSKSSLYFGSNVQIQGPSSKLLIDNNIYLYTSNTIINLGDDIDIKGSSGINMHLSPCNIQLSNSNQGLFLSSNQVYIGGENASIDIGQASMNIIASNAQSINIKSSNFALLFSSNNLYLGGPQQLGTNIYGSNYSYTMTQSLIDLNNNNGIFRIDDNNITIGDKSLTDMFLQMSATQIELYNSSGRLFIDSDKLLLSYSNTNSFLVLSSNIDLRQGTDKVGISIGTFIELDGPTNITDTLTARDAVFTSNVCLMDRLSLSYSNHENKHWDIFLDTKTLTSSDLILKSRNNTYISFTDDFESEILNFTGKHRCTFTGRNDTAVLKGLIVSSCGRYKGLDNKKDIRVDEALPVVKLCNVPYDPKSFGVICGFEDNNAFRQYKIGNLQFKNKKAICDNENMKKVIVNGQGEGAVWVCNANGSLRNGDLITTSYIQGLGMKQDDNIVRSYTVAKITCSCKFKHNSNKYVCRYFRYKNKVLMKALVGCIYKF